MNTLSNMLTSSLPSYELNLPSTKKKVSFRPFLVKEEKILLIAQQSGKYDDLLRAMKNVIESCFNDINNAGDLPLFDIEYMFIHLRAKSVGEEVNPTLVCRHTGEKISLNVNLLDVEVVYPKNHTNKIKLNNNMVINMKYPSVNIATSQDTKNPTEYFYSLVANCIDTIQIKDELIDVSSLSKEEITDFIDNLTSEQFKKIQRFFKTSPKIELVVKYKTSDDVEREVSFNNLTDFFM